MEIMPYQNEPFNGDKFAQERFLELADRYNCELAIETGTALGGTARFLYENFKKVCTIEINEDFQNDAIKHVGSYDENGIIPEKIDFILGDSGKEINNYLKYINDIGYNGNIIYFLDSHWLSYCPLIDELDAIIKYRKGKGDVIVIHDFKVPNTNLGFDKYNDQPFTFDWIESKVNEIYGKGNYVLSYNSDEKSEGAKRGICYLEPNIH